MDNANAKVMSVATLLKCNLRIPAYQRPYKWTEKNMRELLNDVSKALESKEIHDDYEYRLGTIILHEDDGFLDIVDGQQRIISLVLLNMYLDNLFEAPLLKNSEFSSPISKSNIWKNFRYIEDFYSLASPKNKNAIKKAMENVFSVVVVNVKNKTEAFQLFDSQNTRGRALDPHDLLKAYHLREMRDYPYDMRYAVKKWESIDPKQIKTLFADYLYRIYMWSNLEKPDYFGVKDIDMYKGITLRRNYNYATRIFKASPYYQITESFVAGNDFFEMVSHYVDLYNDLMDKINCSDEFKQIKEIIDNPKYKSTGFKYSVDLFYCSLLMYYDKFKNFDQRAIKKLFVWAVMLRVDMTSLSKSSINKYAIGEENDSYTNTRAIFFMLRKARLHTEISDMQITLKKKDSNKKENKKKEWVQDLYNDLYKLYYGGDSGATEQ